MGSIKNYNGMTFGSRKVVDLFPERSSTGKARWVVKCEDCGVSRIMVGSAVAAKPNCQCKTVTHGATRAGKITPEYSSWQAMHGRCRDSRNPKYGGRGITVCDRWDNFENFLLDMGPKPTADHSIERINNDLGYSPENCRWATRSEQLRNTRRNFILEYNGEEKPLVEWIEILGLDYGLVHLRLYRGWNVEQAFNIPQAHRNQITAIDAAIVRHLHKKMSIKHISEDYKIPLPNLRCILRGKTWKSVPPVRESLFA